MHESNRSVDLKEGLIIVNSSETYLAQGEYLVKALS